MRYNKNYIETIMKNQLPPLPEDERIYFNGSYMANPYAKCSNCGFDAERKLWFTGVNNKNLMYLIKLYGVNEATSEKAKILLEEKLK